MSYTEIQLAEICQRLYTTHAGWDMIWTEDSWNLTAALARHTDRDIIVHEGSHTPLDWFFDVISEAPHFPIDTILGDVPAGFYAPLKKWHDATCRLFRRGAIVIGHSLGAARAVEHATLLTISGNAPIAVVAWGCPKPGTNVMAKILENAGVAVRWYENAPPGYRADPVTMVPFTVPLFLPWAHPGVKTIISEPPLPGDSWGPLACHHFELYQAGTAKLNPMPVVP
jgi:hypothetical protein